jgi:Protein of unknown function (DUF2752)
VGSSCIFQSLTGIACPGCGFSRALSALARGEFATAWVLHPLAPFVVVEVSALILGASWAASRGRPWAWGSLLPRLVLCNFVVFVGVWALRWATGTLPP